MVGPTLVVVRDAEEGQWVMELALPPFSFVCVLASNNDTYNAGTLLTDWTQYAPTEGKHYESPVRVGFGWTPYPGDYRSSAQLAADRGPHNDRNC